MQLLISTSLWFGEREKWPQKAYGTHILSDIVCIPFSLKNGQCLQLSALYLLQKAALAKKESGSGCKMC
jgi:hypothetical protein